MTKERSKRSYKRNEIIHAWVHKKENAPETIYYKDSRHSYNCVVGIGDYLFKGNLFLFLRKILIINILLVKKFIKIVVVGVLML